MVWSGLQVPRTRTPAICFLQGSPFPFAGCGRTEQTPMWSLSQVCFETTKILPLPPGPGLPWFPWSWLPAGCFSSEQLEREACP